MFLAYHLETEEQLSEGSSGGEYSENLHVQYLAEHASWETPKLQLW